MAVGNLALPAGGADARNPESAEVALLGPAVAIGVLVALHDGLLGDAKEFPAGAVVPFGPLQEALGRLPPGRSFSCAWHVASPRGARASTADYARVSLGLSLGDGGSSAELPTALAALSAHQVAAVGAPACDFTPPCELHAFPSSLVCLALRHNNSFRWTAFSHAAGAIPASISEVFSSTRPALKTFSWASESESCVGPCGSVRVRPWRCRRVARRTPSCFASRTPGAPSRARGTACLR